MFDVYHGGRVQYSAVPLRYGAVRRQCRLPASALLRLDASQAIQAMACRRKNGPRNYERNECIIAGLLGIVLRLFVALSIVPLLDGFYCSKTYIASGGNLVGI